MAEENRQTDVKIYDILLPLHGPHAGWDSHITDAVRHIRDYFAQKDPRVEIHVYLTNDGTPLDQYPADALDRIREAAGGHFYFLTYEPNRGKGYSLRFLTSRATGSFQAYTDGDFPFGWEPVVQIFETLDAGADVVMGKRGADYNGALCFLRKMISKSVRFLNRLLLGLPGEYLDTQAGLKGFNAAGREAFLSTTVETFIFDTEFILIAWHRKLKIVPIPIRIRPGLVFSSMGFKVLKKELLHFFRILWKIRIMREF